MKRATKTKPFGKTRTLAWRRSMLLGQLLNGYGHGVIAFERPDGSVGAGLLYRRSPRERLRAYGPRKAVDVPYRHGWRGYRSLELDLTHEDAQMLYEALDGILHPAGQTAGKSVEREGTRFRQFDPGPD